jgi:ubiquinone biosynthesis protein UbiJ
MGIDQISKIATDVETLEKGLERLSKYVASFS